MCYDDMHDLVLTPRTTGYEQTQCCL